MNLNREKIVPLPEEPDDPPNPFEIAAEWLKVLETKPQTLEP